MHGPDLFSGCLTTPRNGVGMEGCPVEGYTLYSPLPYPTVCPAHSCLGEPGCGFSSPGSSVSLSCWELGVFWKKVSSILSALGEWSLDLPWTWSSSRLKAQRWARAGGWP